MKTKRLKPKETRKSRRGKLLERDDITLNRLPVLDTGLGFLMPPMMKSSPTPFDDA